MSRVGPIATMALCLVFGIRPVLAQECPTELPLPPWAQRSDIEVAAPRGAALATAPRRVAEIRFAGNRAVGAARLRRSMATKHHRLGRSDEASRYDPARWSEDHRRLCAVFRDGGYVTARVGPPEVADAAPRAGGPPRVVLTIPVEEGPRYRMGELAFEGLSVVTDDEARALFDVRPGEPYRHTPVEEGLQALRRRYASGGHAEWTATTVLRPDAARGAAGVLVRVQEGAPRFVGRILFSGHRGTLDQTLRREVLLDEGDLLDTERLRASIERIEGLGYVTVRGVRLTPSTRTPQALDVWFDVLPRPVVRYGLAGGVNALEGPSLTGVLGTVNLFGRGERAFASAQLGEDVTALDLSASRPHAFGTPWTLGFQAQKDMLQLDAVEGGGLPAYTRDEWAVRVQAQRAVGRRWGLWAGYALSTVRLEAHEVAAQPAGFGRRRESELSSTVRFDGWSHPWKPLRGVRATGWAQWAAGTVDYAKARARTFGLAPLGGRSALGLGVEAGWLAGLGSGQVLPFDERFLLGGEADLRGFDARSVGPRDASGALVGGTRYLVLQGEAHVDATRWLRAVAFVDAGQAWTPGSAPGLGDLRVSIGVEARFAMPVFKLPVRLIYARNPSRHALDPRSSYRIAIGPLP